MDAKKAWILVGGILLIVAIGAFAIVSTVRDTMRTMASPVEQASAGIQTQVAEFMHPTPTVIPDPITIIHEVRSLARLETIQYSIEKIITAEERQGLFAGLFGDKILFVAHGTVIAGVDMAKINEQDLTLEAGVLKVRLPAAEIFAVTLDNQKSYVYNRDQGLLVKGSIYLETEARRVAEEEMRKAAETDGIREMAQRNAEVYLTRLFYMLGYQRVEFFQPEVTPTP
ncbi:MAG TPA: DUF4230 domain-containing protein [Anaerolineaceae bacterium]|nr:DUF4230 domain-containing protein [Anaerolineaceae bacterium]HPN50560.1 DUF4230 domain-containing protein [Anaerolineaceae bacterium]